jgi:hypothetical protein
MFARDPIKKPFQTFNLFNRVAPFKSFQTLRKLQPIASGKNFHVSGIPERSRRFVQGGGLVRSLLAFVILTPPDLF